MSIELPKLPEQCGYILDGIPHMLRFKRGPITRADALLHSTQPVYTADQLRAYGQEAARLALEAAASLCDVTGGEYRDAYKGRTEPIERDKLYNPHTDGMSDGAFECADEIRSLLGGPK